MTKEEIVAVLNMPDNSITDVKLIQDISQHAYKNTLHIDSDIIRMISKVKREFTFAGLYPETLKVLDIQPDSIKIK